jgi:rod shape-determining protein MreC
LFLSLIIFFFSQGGMFKGVGGAFEQILTPMQRLTFNLFHINGTPSSEQMLREENASLLTQLAKQKEMEKENKALHDQFQITNPSSKQLLPASIIGRGNAEFIIDKGENENIKTGQVVISKENVVGIIIKVSPHRAVIRSVSNQNTSFTAQSVKTGALGVIYGGGEGDIVFANVVLSDKLEEGDLVTTRGDIDSNGSGFPPDLIVGKIVSINKTASSLFQTAEIKSLVDFSKLETVFVLVN